jgi:SAM-dependent methyltransferase
MRSDVGGEWNRDAAYHPWIVRVAAEHAGDALDVGCGDGLLALRLAEVSRSVVGIDRDSVAVAQARKRLALVPNTDAAVSEFGTEWGLAPNSYDVITMVSVLHELPLAPALQRAAELLKPGGSLLIVGQTAPRSWTDRCLAWLSTPYARALELFYSWRGMYRPEFASAQPVPPSCSFDEVAEAAAELLPGAELRRGPLERFRLCWSKPVPVDAPEAKLGGSAAVREGAAPASVRPVAALGAEHEDARVLAPDDIDELSRLFEQTREVPTIEPRPSQQSRRSA